MANRDSDEGETWDVGGILALMLVLFLVLAFCLGTRPGNKLVCDEGLAPTFIDCTKVK